MTQGSGQEPHGHCTRGTTREHARSPFPRHGSMQPPRLPGPFPLAGVCPMHFGEKASPMGLSLQLTPLAAAGDKGKW